MQSFGKCTLATYVCQFSARFRQDKRNHYCLGLLVTEETLAYDNNGYRGCPSLYGFRGKTIKWSRRMCGVARWNIHTDHFFCAQSPRRRLDMHVPATKFFICMVFACSHEHAHEHAYVCSHFAHLCGVSFAHTHAHKPSARLARTIFPIHLYICRENVHTRGRRALHM